MNNSPLKPQIHSTAIIDAHAQIGNNVVIGPYCVIGPQVKIDDGTLLLSHVVIEGRTRIGSYCIIHPFAFLGSNPPEDVPHHNKAAELIIGSYNYISSYVSIQVGTEAGGLVTRIGNHCKILMGVQIGHDSQVGNHVVLVSDVLLGGHVKVGDNAVIGGAVAILQFTRIGARAMIAGKAGVTKDVIPYGYVFGFIATLKGVNIIGMQRANISKDDMHAIHHAYEKIFDMKSSKTFEERIQEVKTAYNTNKYVQEIIKFLEEPSVHGICMPDSDAK